MLTILNIINYFSGRSLSPNVIITLSIVIYVILISMYWDSIINNYVYLWIIVILLILDISSIIVIWSDVTSNIDIPIKSERESESESSLLQVDDLNNNTVNCVGDVCKINTKSEKKCKKIKNKKKNKISKYDGKTNTSINTYK